MKTYISLLILLSILCGCEDYMFIHATLNKICKLSNKKYGMSVCGSGVAAPGIIKNFRLSFDKFGEYNEDQARKLIVDFTEDFIITVKNTPEVLEYMENPPVNENHAFFLIVFKDSHNKYQEKLSAVCLANGEVDFNTSDEHGFNKYYCEPYSETYFKVYGTQPPERK